MKYVLFLFLCLVTLLSHAQWGHSPWAPNFQQDSTYMLFGNDVILRAEPNTEAEKLDVLEIGDEVLFIKTVEATITLRDIKMPWLEIEASGRRGFIPMHFLSLYSYSYKGKNSRLLLTNYSETSNGQTSLIFRTKDDSGTDTYIEHEPFLALSNSTISITFSEDTRGLYGIELLITIDYLAEACGESGGYSLVAYNAGNDDLISIGEAYGMGDGGVFYVSEEFILPNDEGGKPDIIIHQGESEEIYDGSDGEAAVTRFVKITKEYTWDYGLFPEFSPLQYQSTN